MADAPTAAAREHRGALRPWRVARGLLVLAFFGLIAWLLVSRARSIDWAEVALSLQALSAEVLIVAALLALLSYALYGAYDLFARHYLQQALPPPLMVSIAAVSYAFNLNMGALVGGVGLRYRLYSRFGLGAGAITRIVGLSLVTNWSGYCLLAGLAGAFGFVSMPEGGRIGQFGLQLLGYVLLAAVAGYLALCGLSRRRSFQLRGTTITLPSLRLAVAQIALSCANWMTMALIVFLLLRAEIAYMSVLAVLLMSSIAGAVTHIPAGLGVIEAVFLAMLASQMADAELLAGLLAYRAVYYLAPLVLAALGLLALETLARRGRIRPRAHDPA